MNHGLTTYDLPAPRLHGYATHRIDIELSARLFRHLSQLPVGYFASRQTGRSMARAQELQAVRSFLTGSSLTAIIDLLFTVVFLAVMAYFRIILTLITVGAMAIIFVAYGVAAPELKRRMTARQQQQIHQVGLSVKRIGEIFAAPREPSVATAQALPAVRGAVRFDRVSFKYNPDGQEVLREVSFDVPAGQVVGVVGVSGAGKSTLARLVQRLYWPQRGRVLIDGVDLALVDPAWLRRQVAHVMQEPFLFNRSIRDNIALADPTLPIEAVMEAAELTGAHGFILGLPKAYDTVVGERGAMLSGGAKTRRRRRPTRHGSRWRPMLSW